MKKFTFAAIAIGCIFSASCNTMIGMSRDVQLVGQGVENKANGKTWKGNQPVYRQPNSAPKAR